MIRSTSVSAEIAAVVNKAARILHRATIKDGSTIILLPAEAALPTSPQIIIDGSYGGASWCLLASHFPARDAVIGPIAGGRPLAEIDRELAALVARQWLMETAGEIANFSIDTLEFDPIDISRILAFDLKIPLAIHGRGWKSKLLIAGEMQLDIAGLAGHFTSAAEPRLPKQLQVELMLLLATACLENSQLTDLAVGDLIVLNNAAPAS